MKRTKLFLLFFLASGIMAIAQEKTIIQNYIEEYRELAIAEMQRTGVPAAIKLAQGIHETMAGTSPLVLKSNNHFGIKCKSNWNGASVSHDDDARGECFRKYSTALDSYRDHSNFLKGSERYASLFQLDPMDYQAWAYGLKRAGYATNPRYPGIIIKLVEEYNLQDYTLIALGKMQPRDMNLAKKQETAQPEKVEAIQAVLKTDAPVIVQPAYPEVEFRINETRVIFARKGVSYLSIAQQYNISLARLFEFNEMRPSEMTAFDQLVYLQRKRKTGNEDFHVVKPGETLQSIAQAQAIRLESLQEYNYLKSDMQPAVGERLALRSKAQAMPRLAMNNASTVPVSQELSPR